VPILIGIGMWTIPTTHAFVPSAGLDPFGMMTTVKVLPAAQYDDYSVGLAGNGDARRLPGPLFSAGNGVRRESLLLDWQKEVKHAHHHAHHHAHGNHRRGVDRYDVTGSSRQRGSYLSLSLR
jgi:hypothetical protein